MLFYAIVHCFRSLDKTVKMWDVERGEMMFSLEQKFSHVHSVCFHPSGNKIAVGSSDNAAYILDAWETEKDILYTLEGHEVPIDILCISFGAANCSKYNLL